MTLRFFILIIVIIAALAIFFVSPKISLAGDHVVINEFFCDAPADDTGKEWIELYNPTGGDIDLTGWQIGFEKYFQIPSANIAAGSFLLIHWRADGDNDPNNIFTGSHAALNNLGNKSGYIALFGSGKRSKETIVDYVEYGEAQKTWESAAQAALVWQAGQFPNAPKQGQSLGLKQDGQNQNFASNWQIFSKPSPGQPNINTAEQSPLQPKNNIPAEPLPKTPLPQAQNKNLKNTLPQTTLVSKTASQPEDVATTTEVILAAEQSFAQNQNVPSGLSASQQVSAKNSSFNSLLALAAIAVLSCVSGVGLTYLKRKKAVDPVQKP